MRIALSAFGFASAMLVFSAGCGGGSEGSGGAGGGISTSTTTASGKTTATSADTTTTSNGTGNTTSTGGGAPTVSMTLSSDTIAAGSAVTATVTVTNFVLEAPVNQPNVAGHGHYHIYLDNKSGGNYLVADQVPSVQVTIPAATTPGPHTLKVSLSDNHHTPLTPAIEDVVNITVQ